MVAYIFQDSLYCEKCIASWEKTAREGIAERLFLHPDHEEARLAFTIRYPNTGCSEGYPQGPYPDGGGEADSPQHCDSCGEFLENPLTEDGMRYVREVVRIHGAKVMNIWAPFYGVTDADAARSAKPGDKIARAIVDALENDEFPTCDRGHNLPIHYSGLVQQCKTCSETARIDEGGGPTCDACAGLGQMCDHCELLARIACGDSIPDEVPMTCVWIAEKYTGGLVSCVTVHATAKGARKALETVLSAVHPGYRETSLAGPYEEGECEFVMPCSFETVGTVRLIAVLD